MGEKNKEEEKEEDLGKTYEYYDDGSGLWKAKCIVKIVFGKHCWES